MSCSALSCRQLLTNKMIELLDKMLDERMERDPRPDRIHELDRPKWRTKRFQGFRRYADKAFAEPLIGRRSVLNDPGRR